MLEYTSLVIPPLQSFISSNGNGNGSSSSGVSSGVRLNITKKDIDESETIGGFLDVDDIGYRSLSTGLTHGHVNITKPFQKKTRY